MWTRLRLRASEVVVLGFFAYVAVLSVWFRPLSREHLLPASILLVAVGLVLMFALGEARGATWFFSYARDWLPLALTLTAYREMDWFTPKFRDYHLEQAWVVWDRLALDHWGLRRAIESTGALLPGYLELCYLLVYAVGPVTIAVVYACDKRKLVDRVLVFYLVGTLGAYAMFPFFPSAPPRTVFAGVDLPSVMTPFREFNLWLLRGYGIHSSVFPSAHVSSAFAAAWALRMFLAERKWIWRIMLFYAVSVAFATVYGRYHYGVDALAGLGVSLGAALIFGWAGRRPALRG